MQINCISCGHRFDLGKNYDDYEGYVKCSTCGGLLDIVTQEGDVKRVRPGMDMSTAAQPQTDAMSMPQPVQAYAPPPQSAPAPAMDADAIAQMQRTILELQQSLASTLQQPTAQAEPGSSGGDHASSDEVHATANTAD